MPDFDLLDPSTWVTCSLTTGAGPIPYWALPDLQGYDEEAVDGGSTMSTLLAVRWQDRREFRKYAIGYSERATTGSGYFNRFAPLRHPELTDHYLVRLKKTIAHAGIDSQGKALPAIPDPNSPIPNWWTLTTQGARFDPRVVYLATFAPLTYDVIDQARFLATGTTKELQRYVTRTEKVQPVIRKVPSYGFYVEGDPTTVIDEVGFASHNSWELRYTWHRVPYGRYPRTAIEGAINRINNAVFDYKLDLTTGTTYTAAGALTTYGRYRKGSVLFEGLAEPLVPYRSASGDFLVDLTFSFKLTPGDGTDDTANKVPRNDGSWVRPVASGTGPGQPVTTPAYLYKEGDFEALFQPEPG